MELVAQYSAGAALVPIRRGLRLFGENPRSAFSKLNERDLEDISRNLVGLKNEGIDKIIELAAKAKTRKDLNIIIRSLDRSLRSLHIWVPQWYKNVHTIAYRNQYSYPKNLPPFELGVFDFWWLDAKKAEILKSK